jgi:hypothetical protein
MTKSIREQRRLKFHRMIQERGLTREETAGLLHVSFDAMKSWLKPETSASSNPVPEWAVELLEFKVPITDGKRAKPAPKRPPAKAARKSARAA